MVERHPVTTTVVGEVRPPRRRTRRSFAVLGLVPFAIYTLLFLVLPTMIAIGTGFLDAEGSFTLDTVIALGDPSVLRAFWSSMWLSAVTSVIGAIVGAAVCWALIGIPPSTPLRRAVDALCGTFAQFGGVMLAFAFIATVGIQGLVTIALRDLAGVNIYENGVWLYQVPGLILPYLSFQIPLMVITFLPAIDGLRTEWAEANAALGGSKLDYWINVGGPVLTPAFLGSLVLLFANAFSSFATAAALISQGAQIVTLQIRAALVSETVLGREHFAGALALAMIIVIAVLMTIYSLLERRTARWEA